MAADCAAASAIGYGRKGIVCVKKLCGVYCGEFEIQNLLG